MVFSSALAATRRLRAPRLVEGFLSTAAPRRRVRSVPAPLSVWLGVDLRLAAHRTIVNSRSQRTDHGQRQISQAALALADREEDDLGAADDVLERHVADLRERGCRSSCRGCRPS